MNWRSKSKQNERRLRKGVFLVSLLLLCVAYPVCRYGPHLYSRIEQYRLLAQTRSLLDSKDYRRAALGLRRVIELNAGNIEAWRLMAKLADQIDKPEAVVLHERVSLLAPGSYDDALAWASSALRFGDVARAREALSILKKTGENRAGTHELAARIAIADRRLGDAQAEFQKALKLAPDDQALQLEAATVDIQSKDAAVREAARQTLERLSKTPEQHTGALRALAVAYGKGGQIKRSLLLARELATAPTGNFQDRLLYLTLLRDSRNPRFDSYLTELQQNAQNYPAQIAMLVAWMSEHGLAMMNIEWLSTLPQKFVTKPPIAPQIADTYILLADWKKLQALTASPGWGDLEFLRLAYLSRALLEEGNAAGSDAQWKAAVALAANQPSSLGALERTAAEWGWDTRLEDLLWVIAGSSKHPQQALQTLVGRYQHLGETRKLYQAVTSLLDHDPTDVALKNNWILLALLVHDDPAKSAQAAEDLYTANPSDPHVAATYAFSLYMTNRTDDALAVMRKLPPEELNRPSVAAYYGVLLAAIRSPEAPKYLDQARQASLLPEEQQLVERARESIDNKE